MKVVEPPYVPQPQTRAARAIAYITSQAQGQPRGAWIANTAVAKFLGCPPNAVQPSLAPALDAGLVERSLTSSRATQWRLTQQKPKRARKQPAPEPTRFGINWPPGFVSRFASVVVPAYETRAK
jgi:hypothetical protein